MAPPRKRKASDTAPEDTEQADSPNRCKSHSARFCHVETCLIAIFVSAPASARAKRASSKRNKPNPPLQVKNRPTSRRGSAQTNTSSEGNGRRHSRPVSRSHSAAKSAGDDLDTNRGAKESRVISGRDSSQTVGQAPSPDGAGNGMRSPEDRADSLDAVNQTSIDAIEGNKATFGGDRFQVSTENSFPRDETDGNTADLEAGEAKRKRPKGWHLRAENRHLLKKGPQASSKATAKVDSLEQSKADRGDGSNPTKRLPGRKRAPHHDPKVEAALRRELDLKTAYRATVKSLKPVLDELAKRTEQDLLRDECHHEDFSEHVEVQRVLDKYLQDRLGAINDEHTLRKSFVDKSKDMEVHLRKAECSVSIIGVETC